MLDGVIFDCDGVLVDSERIGVLIDQRVLKELGLNFTVDEIVEKFMGKSDAYFIETVEALLGNPVPDDWLAEINRQYLEAFEAQLEPVPGIVEALSLIQKPFCVASSGTKEKMRFTLGRTGLLGAFEGKLFSSSEVARGKPHPDVFLFAAEQMGWEASKCLVVEDSQAGVEAGLAAGMRVVAYAGGFAKHDQFQHERLLVIQDMNELPLIVNEPLPWSKN